MAGEPVFRAELVSIAQAMQRIAGDMLSHRASELTSIHRAVHSRIACLIADQKEGEAIVVVPASEFYGIPLGRLI